MMVAASVRVVWIAASAMLLWGYSLGRPVRRSFLEWR